MLKNISNLKGAQLLTNKEQQAVSGGKAAPTSCNPTPQQCHFAVDCPSGSGWDWECCICVEQ